MIFSTRRLRTTGVGLAVMAAMAFLFVSVQEAQAVHCGAGEFSVAGTVTDAITGDPLGVVTSVGLMRVDAPGGDGEGTTLPASTYETCLPAGTYVVSFFADGYFFEWYDAAIDWAHATRITGAEGDHVVGVDAELSPWPVITGRVTDAGTGAPLFTSVGLTDASTGMGLDGEGTDGDGVFEFVLDPRYYPVPGTYLVNFSADYHWSEWFDDAKKRSKATEIAVTRDSGVVSGIDGRLRDCGRPVPDFCIPRNFNR